MIPVDEKNPVLMTTLKKNRSLACRELSFILRC